MRQVLEMVGLWRSAWPLWVDTAEPDRLKELPLLLRVVVDFAARRS
jgi:hypothetical protein